MIFFCELHRHTKKKSSPNRSRTYDLPITSSDALPLGYRLVGAKAIKLGSWGKHPAYCWDLNVDVWHMRNVINVMVFVKPGE